MVRQVQVFPEIIPKILHDLSCAVQIHVIAAVIGILSPVQAQFSLLFVQINIGHAFFLRKRLQVFNPYPVVVLGRRHAVNNDLYSSLITEFFDPVKCHAV